MSKEKELEELKKQLSSQQNDQALPVCLDIARYKNNVQILWIIKLDASISDSTHSLPKTLHQRFGSCTFGICEFFRSLCGVTYFQ